MKELDEVYKIVGQFKKIAFRYVCDINEVKGFIMGAPKEAGLSRKG